MSKFLAKWESPSNCALWYGEGETLAEAFENLVDEVDSATSESVDEDSVEFFEVRALRVEIERDFVIVD